MEDTKLTQEWNTAAILLSFLVGMAGSYTTTYIIYMIERTQERKYRVIWFVVACIVYGGGCIWSLHFTGMLALNIGVPIGYDVGITIASFFIAVLGVLAAFYIKYRNIFQVVGHADVESFEEIPLLSMEHGGGHEENQTLSEIFKPDFTIVCGGFFKGLAIFGMHYTGMRAMIIKNVTMTLDKRIVAASFFACWFISTFALNGLPRVLELKRQLIFAFLSTMGVFTLHYVGMTAATYTIVPGKSPDDKDPSTSLFIPMSVVVIVLLCCSTSVILAAQNVSKQRDNLMDVIRTRRYIETLKIEKDMLAEENKRKTEFMAIVSHEMRTPLHAIAGFTDLISSTKLDKEQSEQMVLVKQSIKVLEFVVDNILNYTRLEHKDFAVNTEWCNLSDIVFNVVLTLSGIVDKDMSILFVNDNQFLSREKCDAHLIVMIVQNLMSNAVKFTDTGCVVIRMHNDEANCFISVQDTGAGIQPQIVTSIFQPFVQADHSLSRKHTGTGLGLAICKQVALKLNGELTFVTQENKGTTFSLTLPLEYEIIKEELPQKVQGKFRVESKSDLFVDTIGQFLQHVGGMQHVDTGPDSDFPAVNEKGSLSIIWTERSAGTQNIFIQSHDRCTMIKSKRPIYLNDVYKKILKFYNSVQNEQIEATDDNSTSVATPVEMERTPAVEGTEKNVRKDTKKTGTTILVAEDNTVNQVLVRKQLEKLGYNVVMTKDGKECVEIIERDGYEPYSCILMDCQMPVMDGFEATRTLRSMNIKIPILALTANVSELSRIESENVGMDAFLSKPLKLKDLQAALEKHMT